MSELKILARLSILTAALAVSFHLPAQAAPSKAAVEAQTQVSREKLKMNRDRMRELARRSPSSVSKPRPTQAVSVAPPTVK